MIPLPLLPSSRAHRRRAPYWAAALWAALVVALPAAPAHRPAAAAGPREGREAKAVVVVADRLAFEDLLDYPEAAEMLLRAMGRGASGMMNVRTLGGGDSASGFLSLAAGARAQGGRSSGLAFHRGETVGGRTAAAEYAAITGAEADGEIVHLGVGELLRLQAQQRQRLLRLGEALRAGGKAAAVVGNADVPGAPRRLAPLLVMSEEGTVLHGDVRRGGIESDPSSPAGWRTNPAEAVAAVLRFLEGADVVVYEFGDLARLEEVEHSLPPPRAEELRREALERLGALVHGMLGALQALEEEGTEASWSLYLLSPSPSAASGRAGVLLTPVALWTDGTNQGALLTSSSTRRLGIVTNTDFLRTFLAGLRLLPPGRGAMGAWESVETPGALAALLSQYQAIKNVHFLRLPVIQPYFFTVLGLIAGGVALVLLVRHGALSWSHRWSVVWRQLLATVLTFPAALLLVPLSPGSLAPPSPARAWGWILLWMALLTALSTWIGRGSRLGAAGAVALITALLVGLDTARGAPLMQRSLLGYDPVAGSRYYGVGNEYMGVLLGSLAVAAAFLLEQLPLRRKALFPVIAFAGAALLLGHPGLGINVGGALSAAVAAGAAHQFGRGRALRLRTALLWLLGGLILLAASGLFDLLVTPERPSHLGQTVERVSEDGADPLWALFERKLAVNLKLIRLTVWSRVALSSFALLGVTLFHPNWLASALRREHPWLFAMARTAVVGAAAALVLNDSGVVAASTLSLWPVMAVLAHSIDLAGASRA